MPQAGDAVTVGASGAFGEDPVCCGVAFVSPSGLARGPSLTWPCAPCTAEYVAASAQSCFRVKAATAAAVVLTLSGLTAEVALQVSQQHMLPCMLGRVFAADFLVIDVEVKVAVMQNRKLVSHCNRSS